MFRTLCALTTGLKHEQRGTPGQDAVEAFCGPSSAAVAVADGAGSREQTAQHGSQAAVSAVIRVLERNGEQAVGDQACALVADAFAHVRDEVLPARAAELGLDIKDLATTLSVAFVTEHDLVVASVGDGIAIVRMTDGSLRLLVPEPPTEFANWTDFVTHRPLAETLRVERVDPTQVESVLLSSDGLTSLLVRGPEDDRFPFSGLTHQLLDKLAFDEWTSEAFAEYLRSSDVRGRSDDDCSLAMLRRVPTPGDMPLRLLGDSSATAGPETRWPCLRRAWPITESAGLHLLKASIDDIDAVRKAIGTRPQVWRSGAEHPLICWPTDIAFGTDGAPVGLIARRPDGQPLKEVVTPAGGVLGLLTSLIECVEALHAAGHAHGALGPEVFCVDRHGRVQLADPFCAVLSDPAACNVRRERDETYVMDVAERIRRLEAATADAPSSPVPS